MKKYTTIRTMKLTDTQDKKLVLLAQKANLTVSKYIRWKLGLERRGKTRRFFVF